ncbi:Catabolite control protein A [Caloramator mitchellensis]|uniref:Catabolite control protein A n=1 Tax=Caloramator mitchellensis TaxID=908809 RepID=A0A0R3JX81_CALMK|nr:LacI family DNA-binding transcriptional regulator [Caloramator mitchellensis]KRQ87674.1 Catabolite control protein A [Caloramator mitchellensis]
MKYTIEDVAKEAGVSITTVSRVINGNYPVKKETRERVEAAIKKLNFQPNLLARSLINKKTFSIGVVIPGLTNMFFTEVVQGIESYMRKYDYDVYISDSRGRVDSEKRRINKFIDRYVDGIILIDPQTENMKNGFIEEVSGKIPIMCINGYHVGVRTNFVLSNEGNGTRQALKYLSELGHENIAFIRGESSFSYDLKEEIYREFSKDKEPLVFFTQDGNNIDVVENTSKLLMEISNAYEIGKEITAFFACNDLMAVGILNGCRELGINVPEDVSVVGFDNIILSQMVNPKLTTVDQNMRLLGEKAAENLINLIQNGSLSCNVETIDTRLIIRSSASKLNY